MPFAFRLDLSCYAHPQMDYEGHPIFEIILPERRISIYANGVVEGCEGLRGKVINRIGRAIRPGLFNYFSKSHEDVPTKSPYTTASPGILASGLSQGTGRNVSSMPTHADAATGEK